MITDVLNGDTEQLTIFASVRRNVVKDPGPVHIRWIQDVVFNAAVANPDRCSSVLLIWT